MGHVCSTCLLIFFQHLSLDPCCYCRRHIICCCDGEIVIDYFNHDWKPVIFEQTRSHEFHLFGLLRALNGREDPICQDSWVFCFLPQVQRAGGDCCP